MAKKVNITGYISSLLYDYSLVVVPGLGAFLTQFAPAKVKPDDGIVQPPVKTLQFNEKLNLNDGLLISHIARNERITEEEAEGYVAHYVDNIKLQLNSGELVVLDGIGSFTKSHADDALIAFFPDDQANFSASTFGLMSVELPKTQPVAGNENEEVTTPIAASLPPLHTENVQANDTEDEHDQEVTSLPITNNDNQKRSLHEVLASGAAGGVSAQSAHTDPPTVTPPSEKSAPSYLWWLVPALMLVAFIFILTQLPSGRNQVAQQTEPATLTPPDTTTAQVSETPQNNLAETEVADNTTSNTNTAAGNFVTDEDDPKINTPITTTTQSTTTAAGSGSTTTAATSSSTANTRGNAATTPTTKTTTTAPATTATGRGNAATTATEAPKGYYVVIASFDTQAKAQKEATRLRKTANNAYALTPDKGKYRVGLYYDSQAAAQSAQASLKAGKYPSAWVLKQ